VGKASWIEVSLIVTAEQAEAVAEILGRFTTEGVVIERMVDEDSKAEAQLSAGEVRVFGYLFIDGSEEDRKMRLEENLFYLSAIQPIPAPVYTLIHDQNWMDAWKNQYKPLRVGNKLAILPAWADNIFPDRIPIRINPGMAFGTGTHPTTQLCLNLMEKIDLNGKMFFDVGCGSGILSAAAVKLGAERAYGVDISPAAVVSSRENARINSVESQTEFIQGSALDISAGVFGAKQAPLVAANILASVILRLLDEGLAELVEPDGTLIVSGILSEQADAITEKSSACGLEINSVLEMDDWAAFSLSHRK